MPGTYLCTDIDTFGGKGGNKGRGKQTSKYGGNVYFLMYNSRFGKQNTEGIGGCVFLIFFVSLMRCGVWVVGEDMRCEM